MWLSQRPQIITLIKWAQNFLLMSFLMHSSLIQWHHLQKSKNPNSWLVQDIQMLWYDWCKIHTLMRQSDWCEIHTLMQQSDCEVHTTLHAKREVFFIEEKNNWELCSRTPHYFPYFLLFHMSPGHALICELASLWFLGIIIR